MLVTQMQEEAEATTVKLTLHCVGVVLMPTVGPCMIMMQTTSPSGIYCVSLTRETSDMVSPLYEHTLLLKKLVVDGAESTLIPLFSQESHFVVHQRVTCRYRLDTQYGQKGLISRLRELIGYTFFLDMERSYATIQERAKQRLLTPLFTKTVNDRISYAYFDCTEEEDTTRLKAHLDLYHQCREKRYRTKKTLYENYWAESVTLNKNALDAASTQLTLYTQATLLYQKADIIVLFKGWKNYKSIASFFIHRVTSLEYTYALHKTLRDAPQSLVEKLWLMTCANRIQLYEFCCLLMKRLITEPVIEWKPTDINLSLFDEVLAGHLYTVLSVVVKQQPILNQELLIRKIKLPMLTQCVILSLEKQAKSRALMNKATLDAVTVANIFKEYQSFTGATVQLNAQTTSFDLDSDDDDDEEDTPAMKVENLYGEEDDEPSTVDVKQPWEAGEKDFGVFLRHLYKNAKPSEWIVKAQKSSIVKSKSVLFFIPPVPATLEIEKDNAIIIDNYLLGKALISVKFHLTNPLNQESWQQDWLNLKETIDPDGQQQYQFMLFNPAELMRNEDLACIKTMLFEDFFNISILRETSDIYFLKRLTHYFAENQTQVNTPLFHKEVCFGSSHFIVIRELAIKETVIVPQCHTLSLSEMRNLIQWFLLHRDTIKRIILIGAPFILPCQSHGQAFLDLLRQLEPRLINQPLYDRESRNEELTSLMTKNWRTLRWDQPKQLNTLLQQEKTYRDAGLRVLYFIRNESLFTNMLEIVQTNDALLFCLYRGEYNKNLLHDSITSVLSAKLKSRFKPEARDVDSICQYNCIPSSAACNMFIITKKVLLSLDKNLCYYLFMSLEKLIVIDSLDTPTKGDLLPVLVTAIQERKKPNVRYSYIASQ